MFGFGYFNGVGIWRGLLIFDFRKGVDIIYFLIYNCLVKTMTKRVAVGNGHRESAGVRADTE